MQLRSRNSAIDLAKYVAAILVIGIHTRPLNDLSGVADFWFVEVICRLAVPLFAVCTGFYLYCPTLATTSKCSSFRHSWLRILKMYLGWSMFYLLIHLFSWHQAGTLCWTYFIGWAKGTVVSASYYHLWYFVALLYAMLWHRIVCGFVSSHFWPALIVALWIMEVLAYAYRPFFPELQSYYSIWDTLSSVAVSATRLLPLLLLGSWTAHWAHRWSWSHAWSVFMVLLCFTALCFEVGWLRQCEASRYSYVIFTLPTTFFLFITLLKSGEKLQFKSRLFAKISMVVYCIHPAIIFGIELVSKHVTAHHLFMLTVIISTLSGLAYVSVKEKLAAL